MQKTVKRYLCFLLLQAYAIFDIQKPYCMLLRKYCLLSILTIVVSYSAIAQPMGLKIELLDNLFLNNIVHLNHGLSCRVIDKKVDFDKAFGFAKTETNTIKVPNFDSFQVIMIALPADNHDAVLSFISATRAGDVVEVYCNVKKKNYPLTYQAEHVAVASIPRIKGVSTFAFYEGNKKVATVKLK